MYEREHARYRVEDMVRGAEAYRRSRATRAALAAERRSRAKRIAAAVVSFVAWPLKR